jgi:LmbE family N-acetylglucosaminyl deacetylase
MLFILRRVPRSPRTCSFQRLRPGCGRPLLAVITALLAIASLVVLSFSYYAAEEDFLGRVALEWHNVDDLPLPASGDRVLVLAPHPDDEVLGTGGLIQQALAAGAKVQVVFLTQGENNIVSFQTFSRRPMLTPSQIRAMGAIRRLEALAALGKLGVPPEQVIFLGYPDNGTLRLWQTHWPGAPPLLSRWSNSRQVPYDDTLSPGAVFSAVNVLADLKQVIADFEPTMIFASHPDDKNPDHQALWLFTQAALLDLGSMYDAVPVWAYLVHYGTWPQTDAAQRGDYLLPPTALLRADMTWTKFLLDDRQLDTKMAALRKHATQLSLRRSYLESFVRPDELFALVDPVRLTEPLFDWQGVEFSPLFGSPKASLLQRLAPGLLLDQFDLFAQEDDILVSLVTHQRLSARQSLVLWLFPYSVVTPFAEAPKLEIVLNEAGLVSARNGTQDIVTNVDFERDGDSLVIRVNHQALGHPSALFVALSMRTNGITVEQTGWRLVQFEPNQLQQSGPDQDERFAFQDRTRR